MTPRELALVDALIGRLLLVAEEETTPYGEVMLAASVIADLRKLMLAEKPTSY